MRGYTLEDMQKMLEFFEIKETDCVLLHASLFNLGRMKNVSAQQIPEYYTNFFLEYLNQGAFFAPAYSYDFPRIRKNDLGQINSEMGNISNYLLELDKSFRSNHPMFSVVGVGIKANKLLQAQKIEQNPFSENSFFHRLREENGVVIILGAQLLVATYIVYCEFILGVEYRYLKPFKGEVINSKTGFKSFDDFYHFVWPLVKNYEHTYTNFHLKMIEKGITKEFTLGKGKVYGFRTQAFFEEVKKFLENEPFGLLSEKPKAFYEFKENEEVLKKQLEEC